MYLILTLLLSIAIGQSQTTYSRDIAPIYREKCKICHRPNDIAPFALNTYLQVSTYGLEIQLAISQNRMPLWKPAASANHSFDGDFSLRPAERKLILNWIDALPQLRRPNPGGPFSIARCQP